MTKKIFLSMVFANALLAGGDVDNFIAEDIDNQLHCPDPIVVQKGYIGGSVVYDELTDPNANAYDLGYTGRDGTGVGGQLDIGYTVFGSDGWLMNVEGRLGMAQAGDIDTVWYGAYVKPQYEFSKAFSIYGLLGYAQVDLSVENNSIDNITVKIQDSVNDFSYGAGIEYKYTEELSLFIDYNQLPSFPVFYDTDIDFDVVSLGLNYNF